MPPDGRDLEVGEHAGGLDARHPEGLVVESQAGYVGHAPAEHLALDLLGGLARGADFIAVVNGDAQSQELQPPLGVQQEGHAQHEQAQHRAHQEGGQVFDVGLVDAEGVDSLLGALGGVGEADGALDGLPVPVLLVELGQPFGQLGLAALVPLVAQGEVHRGHQDGRRQQHQQGHGYGDVLGGEGGLGLLQHLGHGEAGRHIRQQVLLLLGDGLPLAEHVEVDGIAVDDGAVHQLVGDGLAGVHLVGHPVEPQVPARLGQGALHLYGAGLVLGQVVQHVLAALLVQGGEVIHRAAVVRLLLHH